MKLDSNVCPNCGGKLMFLANGKMRCPYCETIFSVDAPVQTVSNPQQIVVNMNNDYSEAVAKYQHTKLMNDFDNAIASWQRVISSKTRKLIFWIIMGCIISTSMLTTGAEGNATIGATLATMIIAPMILVGPFIIKNIIQRKNAKKQMEINIKNKSAYIV